MPEADVVKHVVPAAGPRHFDGDHFVRRDRRRDYRGVLPLGRATSAHGKVPCDANSYDGIDPYHRPIDSSR
jgi:hypothetical protein